MHRFIIAFIVLTGLCLFAFSENEQSPPFDVNYAPSSIQWSVFVPASGCVLTVSGPGGYYWRQEYASNSRPEFSVTDHQGMPLPEGPYRWELVAQLPPGPGGEAPDEPNPIVSGSFLISGGVIIPKPDDAQPAMVEEGAPLRSLFLDREGRLGLGTTVPQSQLHLKGSRPAFTLEDTTTGGRGYTLRSLEKGDGSLGLFDHAGEARWLVDSEGRIGINTTKPTSTLTVDGYIEATKGFLVNGKPVMGGIGFGPNGGTQPLAWESSDNNYFGIGSGGPGGLKNSFFGGMAGNMNTGSQNSFFGYEAGYNNGAGEANSFFGWAAGKNNTTGEANSFFGDAAGFHNNTGDLNAFFGTNAGFLNGASCNSFFGSNAGYSNVTGRDNAFFGFEAGLLNTASSNSFFGRSAGRSNTTGPYNSFFGFEAGYSNTSADGNSFFGFEAGYSSTTAGSNSFFGDRAGRANTGAANAFFGASAGISNTSGYGNNFFGMLAGYWNTSGAFNSFLGTNAGVSNTIENYNTFIGAYADLAPGPAPGSVTNATAIGARAYVAQSNSLVLGSIPNVNGATSYVNVGIGTTMPARQLHVAGPNAVFRMDRSTDTASFILVRTDPTGATPWKTFVVGTNASGPNQGEFIINDIGSAVGGGGNRRMTITNDGSVTFTGQVYAAGFTPTSSRAFKTNIRTFENALETVNRLRGVRFEWKDSGKPAVGLIAEEVNEVLPEVVAQEGGKARGVNYANLVAVLVEAVKEQQKTIEKLERQQDELTGLKAEVERLRLLLQER